MDTIRDAIEKTHIMDDSNIMNEDIRLDNVIVQPDGRGAFRVFMIDFGACQPRRDDDEDVEWGTGYTKEPLR